MAPIVYPCVPIDATEGLVWIRMCANVSPATVDLRVLNLVLRVVGERIVATIVLV